MLSVIIPAHNEQVYLNRTIDNIFTTCSSEKDVEVIVVDQGGNGEIDKRAIVIAPGENVGERKAMNLAAKETIGEYLMRIDAHCDFSPQNWDIMLTNVTGEKDITVAVLTATDKDWKRLPGHWYGLCRLIKCADENGRIGLEAKWQTPNRDHTKYQTIEPNMALTGCGFVIRKDFYWDIGGADESLPKMGAIGEEFAIKAWAHGGKVQTRTDTVVGHIFSTGGYDTSQVKIAQQALWEKWGHAYQDVADKFPNFEGIRLIKTDQPGKPIRTVIVERVDTHETKDPATDQPVRKRVERFKYVWLATEHLHENDLTEKEIEARYAGRATKIGEDVFYMSEQGEWVKEQLVAC